MITHRVELDKLNPTLDEMQEFLDEAKVLGIPGDRKIVIIGTSEGYHFTGTYRFTPRGIRVDGEVDHEA